MNQLIQSQAEEEFNILEKALTQYCEKMTKDVGNSYLFNSHYANAINEVDSFRKKIKNDEDLASHFNDRISKLIDAVNNHYYEAVHIFHGGERWKQHYIQ